MSDIFPVEVFELRIASLYYSLNLNENELQPWENLNREFQFNKNAKFYNFFVDTRETVQVSWLLGKFVQGLDPFYISGYSGIGKTTIIQQTLQNLGDSI